MEEVLRYQLHQILICGPLYGYRGYRHYEISIAQESHAAAMDPEIRCLLAMAAELSAMAAELSAIPAVMILMNLSVVMP